MGGYSSKIVKFEDAKALLGTEYERFVALYHRLAVRDRYGDEQLSSKRLIQSLLSDFPGMPYDLAKRFVAAIDTGQKDMISLEEFICAMAVLTKGNENQKLQFVFHVYDSRHCGRLESERMHKFCDTLVTSSLQFKKNKTLLELFGTEENEIDWLTFKKFGARRPKSMLIQWVMQLGRKLGADPKVALLAEKIDPKTRSQAMARNTHFNEKEVRALQLRYKELKAKSPSGKVDRESMQLLFASSVPPMPPALLERIFSALDLNSNGVIDTREFVNGLSIACRGTADEKVEFCFSLYDADLDGRVSRAEVEEMMSAALDLEAEQRSRQTRSRSRTCVDQLLFASLKTGSPTPSPSAAEASEQPRDEKDREGDHPESEGEENDNPRAEGVHPALDQRSKQAQLQNILEIAFRPAALPESAEPKTHLTLHEFRRFTEDQPISMQILAQIRHVAGTTLKVRPNESHEEATIIRRCYKSFAPRNLVLGEKWFVIDMAWWSRWTEYSGFSTQDRGKIRRLPSMEGETVTVPAIRNARLRRYEHGLIKLRTGLSANHDYKIVPQRVWDALSEWYGADGAIGREVVAVEDELELELYPLDICVGKISPKTGRPLSFGNQLRGLFSKTSTAAAVRKYACERFQMDPKQTRMWIATGRSATNSNASANQLQMLAPEIDELSLEDAQLVDGQRLFIEERDAKTLEWPRGNVAQKSGAESSPRTVKPRHSSAEVCPSSEGLVGLCNLGNTCFMNASLQCFCNTPVLKQYCMTDSFKYDINVNAKMGLKGEIALAFSELMTDVWTTDRKAIAPRRFRRVIGKFKDIFATYQQQDAQEFLSCLVDGLNEDLNRIDDKPYTENPDSEGRPDKVVAEIWWQNLLRRDFSIIAALFMGQFKSLVKCMACNSWNAQFDQFQAFLPIALPEPTHRTIIVTVVSQRFASAMNLSPNVQCSVRVPRDGTVDTVCTALQDQLRPALGLQKGLFVLAQVARSKVLRVLVGGQPLRQVGDRTQLFAFEIDPLNVHEQEAIARQRKWQLQRAQTRVDMTSVLEPGVRVRIQRTINNVTGFFQCIVSARHEIGPDPLTQSAPASTEATVVNTKSVAGNNAGVSGSSHNVARYCYDVVLGTGKTVEKVARSFLRWTPPKTFSIGDAVSARFNGRKRYYPGKVVGRDPATNTYEIAYTDGDNEPNVPVDLIELRNVFALLVFVIHRRLRMADTYFNNPFKSQLFGLPMILRFVPEERTGLDLYNVIWSRAKTVIRRPGVVEVVPAAEREQFLAQLASLDTDERLKLVVRKWGFVVKRTDRSGHGCPNGKWLEPSNGKIIWPDRRQLMLQREDTLALDWDHQVLEEEFDNRAFATEQHPSLLENAHVDNHPLSLVQCLQQFTAEEVLEAGTKYCKACTNAAGEGAEPQFPPHSKKIDFWRLPPVIMIHLKRFHQGRNNVPRKLNNLVTFPLEGLDMKPFMAQELPVPDPADVSMWSHLGGQTVARHVDPTVPSPTADEESDAAATPGSVQDPPATLPSDLGPLSRQYRECPTTYDLFGVVNHYGAYGAGHYTAYVKRGSDGKWRLFNDSRVEEVDPSKVVSREAYVLFYKRTDVSDDTPLDQLFPQDIEREMVDVSQIGRTRWPCVIC